jgi:hypothetical protein
MRIKLKMKILEAYGNQTKFARVCERRDDWISKIISGRYDPTEAERKLIALHLPPYNGDLFEDQEVGT